MTCIKKFITNFLRKKNACFKIHHALLTIKNYLKVNGFTETDLSDFSELSRYLLPL